MCADAAREGETALESPFVQVVEKQAANPALLATMSYRKIVVAPALEARIDVFTESDAGRVSGSMPGNGVVFVADSQIERMEANVESLENLGVNLKEQGYDLANVPYIVQYNKRDLPNAAPLDEMRRLLNPGSHLEFEASARTGMGVFETLKAVARGVLSDLKRLGG